MTEPTSRQTRLHELFTAALHLPPAQQKPYLLRSCPDDPALVREVLALLRAVDSAPDDFLTPPDPPSFLSKATPHPPAPYDPAKDTLPGRRLKGRYTIQHRLGEGGMSVVYEGEQDHPRRRVAIKIMRPQFVSPKVLRRFRDEPEILAQLNHPHIVRVFEADVEDFGAGDGPQPYFVMECVDGIPLTQYARERRLPLRRRLELFAIVCDAVQEAHQRGIIHRDLKPGNILVTAEGKPMLLDFGVAKVLATSGLVIEHTLTGELQLIGTLQYMSPEQCDVGLGSSSLRDESPAQSDERPKVSSRSDELPALTPEPQPRTLNPDPRSPIPDPRPSGLDTRSDVYALGVLLYELVTDRLPYDVSNMTIVSAARTICEAAPTPPSHFDRRLRGDLDAIILKALEKNRAHRYASAAHLEDDVRRYLSGEPTFARPTTRWRKMSRWAANHPKLTTGTLAFCAGLLGLIPAKFAYDLAFQRGALAEPGEVFISAEKRLAILKSINGEDLHRWTTRRENGIAFGDVVSFKPEQNLRPLVIIGFSGAEEYGELSRSVCAFEWPRLTGTPAWRSFIEDDRPVPDPFERRFTPSMFRCVHGWLIDVFAEPKGDEIIVYFQHQAFTQGIFRIYDLAGRLLYQVWFDGNLNHCAYLPEGDLLVLSGLSGAVPSAERGFGGKGECIHPGVVFAIRPEIGFIRDEPLFVDPVPDFPRAVWCKTLVDAEGRAADVELRVSASQLLNQDEHVHVEAYFHEGVEKWHLDFELNAEGEKVEGPKFDDSLNLAIREGRASRKDYDGFELVDLPTLLKESQDPGDNLRKDDPLRGSPYRWARLLGEGKGTSRNGSGTPLRHPQD